MNVEDQIAAGPKVNFSQGGPGYRADIEGGRAIEIRPGTADDGRRCFHLRTENQGFPVDLVFSEEALDAITQIYTQLIVDQMDAACKVDDVPA